MTRARATRHRRTPGTPCGVAQSLLDAAGIPHVADSRTGHVPQAIAQYARETGCFAIVMGTRGMGTTDHVLGSIARQVISLVDVPVTLVK
jgi:nucleotide-binding universal stress UspA family protein